MSTEEQSELATRLAKARAERAERAARRERREEAEAEAAMVEAEEIENRVEAAIEEAEDESYRLDRNLKRVDVTYPDGRLLGAVLVKTPNPMHWGAFENSLSEAKGVEKDHLRDKLWQRCLVWPDVATVERYVADQPFTRQRLCDAIAVLAGVRVREVGSK